MCVKSAGLGFGNRTIFESRFFADTVRLQKTRIRMAAVDQTGAGGQSCRTAFEGWESSAAAEGNAI
jgi:hypothetical protein